VPHGRLTAWYEDGRPLASGAFAAGRVSARVEFLDARGRVRYRLEPESAGVMDGHAFDDNGAEIAPGEDWLPKTLPRAYDLLMLGANLTGLARR
jgi:hypothetical protein